MTEPARDQETETPAYPPVVSPDADTADSPVVSRHANASDPEAPDAVGDAPLPPYKGAPLDPERGPGLGCFWLQIALLAALLVLTPLSVILVAPPWLSAAMLILTLVLLFFVGQTTIFLLRLVAADRRAGRRPLREGARRTVGQLESEDSEQHDP